ncbi:MAG TPA: hypothetical protein VGD14_02705 [bacterium]
MSISIDITKKEIINELNKVHPLEYLKVFVFLKQVQLKKFAKKKPSQALDKLFALEGCLSDMNMTSLELQKKVADMWSEKFETR